MNKYKVALLSGLVLSTMALSNIAQADTQTLSDVNSYTVFTTNKSASKPSDRIVINKSDLWTKTNKIQCE